MSRDSGIRRCARFLRHCRTVGFGEARRRVLERQETARIREERARGIVPSAGERQAAETLPRRIHFEVIPLENTAGGEIRKSMRRSLEEQTYGFFRIGTAEETGDDGYLVFAEEDGYLHPSALFEMAKAVCATGADLLYADEDWFEDNPGDLNHPWFKPDYGPDTLRGCNIAGPFLVCRKSLMAAGEAEAYARLDGDGRWNAVIRLAEKSNRVEHIPRVLYFRRAAPGGTVPEPVLRRICDPVEGEPLVSVLIPNKDHREDLQRCVESIRTKSSYSHWEMIILENNSTEEETFRYYEELEKDSRIRVIRQEGKFNYSAVNNAGFRIAEGEQILLLNNDTEVISPDWIQEMLMFAQRNDVGAVGAKLYYPDGTIQHAGIGIGIKMLAGHLHRGFAGDSGGYFGRLRYAQDVSAVTAACMMIPRRVYEETGGLDESFSLVFNDVDLCLRIRKAGYRIVWTPWAELVHYESKSRGPDEDTPEKKRFFVRETNRFLRKWHRTLEAGDPYYNRNLTREKEDFSLR